VSMDASESVYIGGVIEHRLHIFVLVNARVSMCVWVFVC